MYTCNILFQRAVGLIDPSPEIGDKITSSAQIFKDGHKGIVTLDYEKKLEDETLYQAMYQKRLPVGKDQIGKAILNMSVFFSLVFVYFRRS